jgi:hypothetical protein
MYLPDKALSAFVAVVVAFTTASVAPSVRTTSSAAEFQTIGDTSHVDAYGSDAFEPDGPTVPPGVAY